MKITKAMGRACLLELKTGCVSKIGDEALEQIGWLVDGHFANDDYTPHEQTALALCAAIAGVKPEDVE